jgi:tape measure domain-containing protein
MANSTITGGSVVWNFDVDKAAFDAGLSNARNQVDQLGNHLKKSEGGFRSWAREASDSFNGIAGTIQGLATAVLATTVGAGGLGAVFVKSAADMQATAKQFDILIGNTEIAQDLFAQLARFAAETPFEFPQIAKAGKTLLGFGIASQDVFGHINTLGDLAAATGANFESLAVVFGQVNATGRLMGQDALQLINNNIPITTILAKKLGVSVQEVKKRMEEGNISAQLFNEALTDVTKQGGFAFKGMEGLAQTFTGRMSTLKDTVMEFGRNLLGVRIDPELGLVIKPGGLFDRLTNLIPKITAALTEMAPKISGAFETLITHGPTILAVIAGIATAFVAAKVAAIGFFVAANIANPFFWIVVAIGALAALQVKFGILTKALDFLRPAIGFVADLFGDLFTEIVNVAKVIGQELQPVFRFISRHADVIKKVLLVLIGVAFTPLIIAIGAIVVGIKILTKVLGFIADHFDAIKKVILVVLAVAFWPITLAVAAVIAAFKLIPPILSFIGNLFTTIGTTIWSVMQSIWNVVVTVFTAIWNFISPILSFLRDLFVIIFGAILIVVLTILIAIKDFIMAVFTAIWNFISPIVTAIKDAIVGAWQFVHSIVTGALTALRDFIAAIWNTIWGIISDIVGKIINFFSGAWNWLYGKGKDIVLGLAAGIRAVGNAVWDAIKSVADKIGQFFSGAWNWLYDVGRAIVEGLVRGIKSMVKSVSDAAGNIGDAVKNKVKNLLGISSPSKVMAQYGQWTMEGFAKGIAKGNSMVMDTIGSSLDPVYSPTVSPSVEGLEYDRGPAPIVNHIGEINIGNEVDGENWLKKLTRDEEVTSQGLTNYAV